MHSDPADAELAALRAALCAYDQAPVHQRALMRLRGEAPRPAQRARLRHLEIGVHGRIAEAALRLVAQEEAITAAMIARGIEEDLSLGELRDIREELLGRYATAADTVLPVLSLPFENDPDAARLLSRVMPGSVEPEHIALRRYAAVADEADGRLQPFLVYEGRDGRGHRHVLGRVWLDGAFLRHEQSFSGLAEEDLAALEALVAGDLRTTLETRRALLGRS